MKRSALVATLAIFIALCLGFSTVYGQQRQQRRTAGTQRPAVNMARLLMRLIDLNNDGQLSGGEYMRFFVDADQDKDGSVSQKEMTELINKKRGERPALGQQASGPDIGQEAPDFILRTLDGKGTVTLSDLRGKKPVVLVFGSYT